MILHGAENLHVRQVPPEDREDALHLVLRDVPAAERVGQVAALLSSAGKRDPPGVTAESAFSGLLEARRDAQRLGAVWVQRHAGKTAAVWPPRLSPGQPEPVADELLAAAMQWLPGQPVRIAQSLLTTDVGVDADRLRRAGFHRATELLYLVSVSGVFPQDRPPSELQFEPYSETIHQRLASVLEQTYRQTLDCPQLNGLRDTADVLAGYRDTGVFDPRRWLLVRHGEGDVGCLLLADHPTVGHWELVYMGLAPRARGKGWGVGVTRYAQWLAGQSGTARLVLAVDAANQPAIDVYAAAGFVAWDRRSVFLRVFPS